MGSWSSTAEPSEPYVPVVQINSYVIVLATLKAILRSNMLTVDLVGKKNILEDLHNAYVPDELL